MRNSHSDDLPADAVPWLVRIPEIFGGMAPEILQRLGGVGGTRLGQDYYLIKTTGATRVQGGEVSMFLRWNMPVEHSWPCNPRKMDGFIEKAAQMLWKKFGSRTPQGIFTGALHPTSPDRYYRSLSANLRGRMLQLFPPLVADNVEDQNAEAQTLFCLVGREGLFCGMQSPRAANGLYPGGSKFIDQNAADTISRAGAKIAEALHYLLLYRPPLPQGAHWLELGACPGGMTSELLARGQRVTAIDRAPLDKRLVGKPGLRFLLEDVAVFQPRSGTMYDALLCDMNGAPEESMKQVVRLSRFLKSGGLVVFTLKVPRIEDVDGPCALFRWITGMAAAAGLRLFARTHLTYNRHELTLFFETV